MLLALLLVAQAWALTCQDYADPQEQGQVSDSPILEASGLAYARDRAGVWFTHNDAGGQPELYAFELGGTFIGTHLVEGGGFGDWEALSHGPCPDSGSCLYIGDVGDNGRARAYVSVYAVREPVEGESARVIATWNASYPDATARDSEALMVHPITGRIDLITKEDAAACSIYRFPEQPTGDALGVLGRVASLSFEGEGGSRTVTGADWDPDGDRVVIRTYSTAYEWRADPCDPDAHWGADPRALPTSDVQGEALAYNAIGDIVTCSEGSPMVVKRLVCSEAGQGSGGCDTGLDDSALDDDSSVFTPPSDDGGCACSSSERPTGAWTLLALVFSCVRTRRRRCPDRSLRR
jgi:MYXO-CTERM domain-containing protein